MQGNRFYGKHPARGITFYSSGYNPELQRRNIFSFDMYFCGKANKNHGKTMEESVKVISLTRYAFWNFMHFLY